MPGTEDNEKPRNYRSFEKVEANFKEYEKSPASQIQYVGSILEKIDDGAIIVDRKTREWLQDIAAVIWDESPPDIRKRTQKQIEYIFQSAREFETEIGESEAAKNFRDRLYAIVGNPEHKKKSQSNDRAYGRNLGDKISAVAVYAGLASALIYFSTASITGNVILNDSNTLLSRGVTSILIGILVLAAFILFSRKR